MREIGFLDSGRIKLDFQTEGNTRQVGEKLGIPEIDGNGNCDETCDRVAKGWGGGAEGCSSGESWMYRKQKVAGQS